MGITLIFRDACRFAMILSTILLLLPSEAYTEQDTGYLYVTSQPKHAMIYVDSVYTSSRTPTSKLLNFKSGAYGLSLTKQGYNIYEDRITIKQGTVLEVDVAFAKIGSAGVSKLVSERYVEAYITVRSTPSDADVYLDDELIGKTPVHNHRIQAGEPKDRNLRIVKADHSPHEETVSWITIRNGIKLLVSANLEPIEKTVTATPKATTQPTEKKPKKERFVMTTQVMVLLIALIVVVAILTIRVIIRLRRRSDV